MWLTLVTQGSRYHKTLMSTYPFLHRICGRHYSRWHTFLARYDDKPPKVRGSRGQEASVFPPYRVGTYVFFSDRFSWIVTFDQQTLVVLPPQMVLDTSLLARDPLYTGSLLVAPRKGHFGKPCIELRGVAWRLRLIRLIHILSCVQLSQFVWQFLARLVITYSGRSDSQCVSELDPGFPTVTRLQNCIKSCRAHAHALSQSLGYKVMARWLISCAPVSNS